MISVANYSKPWSTSPCRHIFANLTWRRPAEPAVVVWRPLGWQPALHVHQDAITSTWRRGHHRKPDLHTDREGCAHIERGMVGLPQDPWIAEVDPRLVFAQVPSPGWTSSSDAEC